MSQASQQKMEQKPDTGLKAVKDLSKIFPDIQGQLCSRHSTLFGKLKTTFNKMYDKFEPSHYIVVKGNTHIIGQSNDDVGLSLALENGVTVLVAKTFPDANIYINGNHMDQEVILDCKGKIQEGLYEFNTEVQKICGKAIASQLVQNLSGGIIYVHANIAEGHFNYQNSLLTGLYIAMLIINNGMAKLKISELIHQMGQTGLIDQMFLEKQFYDYENREFSLMVGETMYKVPLQRNIKLVFCQLDLANQDIKHSQKNISEQKVSKSRILQFLQRKWGVKSFYQAFQNEVKISDSELNIVSTDMTENQQYKKLIEAQMKELKVLCEYSNQQTSVEQLICMKWFIDSKLREVFSDEVVELVESVKEKTRIQACTIVERQYLMMAVESRHFTEMICVMRGLLNKGELKSKSCFKLEQQLIENRWGNEQGISQKIFVSVPSKGIAIFDPSQAIWFD